MMTPENDATERPQQPQHEPKLPTTSGARSLEADTDDNQHEPVDQHTVAHRGRAQSDAARRNEREAQRETTHQQKTRLSVLHNRFLARKESRSTSGDANQTPSGSPTTRSSSPARQLKNPTRRPDDDDGDNNDVDDGKPMRRVVEESALVVTRRRSSAASSAAAGTDTNKSTRAGRNDATSRHARPNDRAYVLTPSVHVVPSLALTRSKWTRELEEDAACGLYVDDERRELAQVASSTLVRLEERLRRERSDEADVATGIRLNDLLHVSHAGVVDAVDTAVSAHDAMRSTTTRSKADRTPTWTTAMLEVTIDRLVLDDHVSFSLADRIETQLRSLYVAYTHLLHAQPWRVLLHRIDAFVEAQLLHDTPSTVAVDTQRWQRQSLLDAQTLQQALGTLQQLHYQLLTKWHELQDCYRQPALTNRVAKLRVTHERRAESLVVASLRAFLELDDGDYEMKEMRAKLRTRLDELETKDQYLHTVLRLEAVRDDSLTTSSTVGSHHNAPPSLASCFSRGVLSRSTPRFYVALFINGNEVGRTKAASWSGDHPSKRHVGVVTIQETLRTQLHFFPDAVTIKVFERSLVFADTLLSTTSIPLLVPGHDLVRSGSLREARNRVAAASLASSVEWYQFSSVAAMPRSRWHATFLNSTLFATFERHPHGRVRAHVAWVAPFVDHHVNSDNQQEGDDERDAEDRPELEQTHVVLPLRRVPVAASHNAKLVGPRVDRRRLYSADADDEHFGNRSHDARHAGFSYERDFLVHIADPARDAQLAVDRNDPQNASVVRLQDHVKAQSSLLQARDLFRATSLVYDATLLLPTPSFGTGRAALTRRNFLLQLRDREHVAKHGTSTILADTAAHALPGKKWDHDAFDEPLPLSEHAIATNAKFLSLVRPELPAFDYQQQLDDAFAIDTTARVSLERARKLQLLKLQDFVGRVRASQVARIHNKALASSGKQRDRTKTLATIIQEQPLPLLPGAIDFSGLGTLFSRRRRLRPRVESRTAPATMADWPRHCMLYVQIKGATNVPVRVVTGRNAKPEPRRGTGRGGTIDDEDDETPRQQQTGNTDVVGMAPAAAENSHVFVEISFQGRRRRTTSTHVRATGAVWMETVALPFNAPQDDWSPDSLQKSPDVVRLNLFDQLVRTTASNGADDEILMLSRKASETGGVQQDDPAQQQRVQSFHQENRFLGSLEIPFTTLYHNHGTLDATLRCEMPVVNVGYVNAKHGASGNSDDASDEPQSAIRAAGVTSVGAERDDDLVVQSSREATFLSVMMTLDPLLPMPVKSYEENPLSAGDDYAALAAYASHWKTTTQSLNPSTKHRDFHVFVRSLAHGQTFLTRYIAPQTPPPLHLHSSTSRPKNMTVAQVVRYVHLIPFLDDWQLFDDGGELDVWTTSQELLELNAGDFEEHAVLLCNYLNWLDRDEVNRRSFLVLATAVPEGHTVYVLRQDSYKIPQRSVLWNACSGIGYSVLDDRCPVLDISLVVSSENIYANIQPKRRLSELNWDVETNTKAWRPFFHASHKKELFMLPTVQTTALMYAETRKEYVEQVEVELREALKVEIRRWRSIKFTTTFNMDLSMKLRAQLERLELAKLHGQREAGGGEKKKQSDGEPTTKDPIVELQTTRRVSGMPLNTTFTDINKVIAMVKNTNIYWNDHSKVEFGLAVYVHAYPNCILSIWVYLVAVEPIE